MDWYSSQERYNNVMSIDAITCPERDSQCFHHPSSELYDPKQSDLLPFNDTFHQKKHPTSTSQWLLPDPSYRRPSDSSSSSSSSSGSLHLLNQNEPHSLPPSNNSSFNSSNKNSDSMSRRRERNKVASAKYRAKKQNMTHSMQAHIIRLASQVAALKDELIQTKKNESDLLIRYTRLQRFCKDHHQLITDLP